jgi:shikimate kinase
MPHRKLRLSSCTVSYLDGDIAVKRILLTGISGVGKSTVTDELARRGYMAVDADGDDFSEWVAVSGEIAAAAGSPVEEDRDWMWREDRMAALLATEGAGTLFVSGCAANMGKFLHQFDHVVLLSTPADITVERLQTRTNNAYGKHPDEVARVLSLKDNVEPVLRRVAGHEIDTTAPLDDVVDAVLQCVQA